MAIRYNRDSRFLFIGDGPTDVGRAPDPEEIGTGFVRDIRDYLRANRPSTAPIIVNHGASGLRLAEWLERWPHDALGQRPDVISLHFDVPDPSGAPASGGTKPAEFLTLYRELLAQTKEGLPDCQIVLCQPAAAWSAAAYEADDALRPYVRGLLELAREFRVESIVPVHEALVYVRRVRSDIAWITSDGRFTSGAHMLFAYTWLEQNGLAPRAVS